MVESPFSLDIILFNGSFDSSSSFIILESSIGLWCTNNNCMFVCMFFFFCFKIFFFLMLVYPLIGCNKFFFRDNFAIKMSENFQLQLNTLKMAPTVLIDQTVANSHNLIEKVFLCYYYCLLSN